ncbi:MAG: galactose-1-phosphate uridylyltransferase [Candidatus Rokuibacteriota bacterium]|nr:MAG: galactose-1-phosphate uridylyltransferase [Candidatus Rokubacteria bacterium]
MDELRKDPTRGRWVLIRPKAKPSRSTDCPYCPGAEHLTGPEIAAYRPEGPNANGPGWTVRVVPEPDAYFRIEWELVREGVGMFDMINPRGASELVVESPRHDDTLATMEPHHVESVLWMYRDRLVDLKRDGQIRDILVSRRHKKPGVAPHHPYSRVTAIPIVFDEMRRELREAREYYQYKRRCLYCDIVRQEIGAEERVVRLTAAFAAIVPYAPRVPHETWVVPRQHDCSFEEALKGETAADLARLLSDYFRTLEREFGDPGYELVLHTAPNLRSRILQGDWATIRDDYHWHIEITPERERANRIGGIYINETPPEVSAAALRRAWPDQG